MLAWIIEFQKETYLTFGEHVRTLAAGGGATALLAFLPLGLVLGAVHALMPGYSKLLLGTYVASSSGGMRSALLTAFVLAATHISISVLIVLLSLPVIDYMFGGSGPGSSPLLEHLSRGLIGLIGLWMIWRGMSGARHDHARRKGASFGFLAGLIPCPLTLFVMTYATARGVPALGLVFAALMLAGVAATLSAVAIAATAFRAAFNKAFNEKENCLGRVSNVLEISAVLVMVGVALNSIA